MKTICSFYLRMMCFSLLLTITDTSFGQGFIEIYDDLDFLFSQNELSQIIQTNDGGFLIRSRHNELIKTNNQGQKEWSYEFIDPDTFNLDVSHSVFQNPITNNFEVYGHGEVNNSEDVFSKLVVSNTGNFVDFVTNPTTFNIPTNAERAIHLGDGNSVLKTSLGFATVMSKISNDGTISWQTILSTDLADLYNDLFENNEGEFMTIHSVFQSGKISEVNLVRISENGETLPPLALNITPFEAFGEGVLNSIGITQNSNNEYLVVGFYGQGGNGSEGYQSFSWLLNEQGETISINSLSGNYGAIGFTQNLVTTESGDFIFLAENVTTSGTNIFYQTQFGRISSEGDLIWIKNIPNFQLGASSSRLFSLAQVAPEIFVAHGALDSGTPFLIQFNGNGEIYNNILNGNLTYDVNENCELDTSDLPFKNWIVEATNQASEDTFYALSDSLGNFQMDLDTGSYVVEPQVFLDYWAACEPSILVNMPNYNDTTNVNFSFIPEADCPLMFVDVAAPFYRRCFTNNIYVNYCNLGAFTAENTQIEVILDEFMIFETADLIPSFQMDSLLIFDIGDVPYGECGTFKIEALIDCGSTVLGQTHCVSAHIFPDTLCLENNYSDSNIEIIPECATDSVYFHIKNTGSDMDAPLPYIVIEDNIIARTGEYQLLAQETITISLEAHAESTYHCQAQQPNEFPSILGNANATATIEGCIAPINIGVYGQFPDDDGEPYLSIDCQENIGAYDPNDKRGFPLGLGEQHLIEANESIDYHIRFQNTGTDTAFTVVLQDTLSNFLNVPSIRAGASSHPYQLDISGQGNLTFTFNDIMLPDSNVNEAASHGFVRFKIDQQNDLPSGTVIENTAAIYFDFNDPIFTNTTFHEVSEKFIDVLPVGVFNVENKEIITINCAPNPFQDFTIFDLSPFGKKDFMFELYHLNGQKIRTEKFQQSTYRFEKKDLPKGMYIYRFLADSALLGVGKFIVH